MIHKIIRQVGNAARYSFDGLRYLVSSEFAARLEIYGFIWVFVGLLFLKVPTVFLVSTLVLFLVLLAVEALNTAVEVVIDRISPEISQTGKHAKDLGSFAVMCLLAVNGLHGLYVLKQVDWARAQTTLASPFGGLFVSLVLAGVAIYSFTRRAPSRWVRYLLVSLCAVYLFSLGVFFVADFFTGQGVDDNVIYHLQAGLKGAGFSEYLNVILASTLYLVCAIFILVFINDLLGKKAWRTSKSIDIFANRKIRIGHENGHDTPAAKKTPKKPFSWIGISLLGLALFLSPAGYNTRTLLATYTGQTGLLNAKRFFTQPVNIRLSERKNVVYIYLEGLERTYFDPQVFPKMMPRLSQIERENLHFTDIRQAASTGFTIGGIVASQCGSPILAPHNANSMGGYDQFLPNLTCMGDILDHNNYTTEFMGGADLEFAGKGNFYNTHGFDKIVGRTDWYATYPTEEDYSPWGLHDDKLFDAAFERYTELSEKSDPFALFMLTVDTHHPRGHISQSCTTVKYENGKTQLLNALQCTDRLVSDFIEKIQNSPAADNTLIVISSDHLALRNEVKTRLDSVERRNFLAIIDPSNPGPREISRPGTMLDVAPTVLSFLGFPTDNLGFGRNLLGPRKTLVETYPKTFNGVLRTAGKQLQQYVWDYPIIENAVRINLDDKHLEFGNRWVTLPVILIVDDTATLTDLRLDHSNPRKREGYLSSLIPSDENYIWVDQCRKVEHNPADAGPDINTTDDAKASWCIAVGSKTGRVITRPVSNKTDISKTDILDAINKR